jgi:hypothetical protein
VGRGETEIWLLQMDEDKLVDALYNTALVLDRYRKLQLVPMSLEGLVAFLNKVDNFCDKTKNWSKKS